MCRILTAALAVLTGNLFFQTLALPGTSSTRSSKAVTTAVVTAVVAVGLSFASYSSVPECGVRFGQGMLGRGHSGPDLDSNSEYGEYPWHVAILTNIGGNGRYFSR